MLRAGLYSALLVWLNFYIARDFFWTPAAATASMQGFWIAIAERAQGAWFHPSWWPFWACGMPFEYTYAPLVPALTAAIAAIRGVPLAVAFHAVTGLVYIATPLTLFWMASVMTGSAGYSFLAAVAYSLMVPAQVIAPDAQWSIANLWQPWRLTVLGWWDDTPHQFALALVPLAIVFLWLSIRRPRWFYLVAAAVAIALASYASVFGPVAIVLASVALVAAEPVDRARAALRIAGIGAIGYALASAFLPPSLILAIANSANNPRGDVPFTARSFTALALTILGWTLVWLAIRRVKTPHLRFFILFAYLASAIPCIWLYLHRGFLPQPWRYRAEMDLALCVALAFGVRAAIKKVPRSVKGALLLVALSLAAEQIVTFRQAARQNVMLPDIRQTIEYHTTMWTAQNLPGVRLMLPGSIAQWADAFAPVEQFTGGSWSLAANQIQQRGLDAILSGGARVSLAWLKANGVGAIAMSGKDSQEYWKPYADPGKFEGVLPALWRDRGITVYRVPQRSPSFAHVIPASALVRRVPGSIGDILDLERYNAALDDPSIPLASFAWSGRNRILIQANSAPGQVISIQVSDHPGWRARSGNRALPIHRDALGFMWLECPGRCEITLDYTGGFELRLFRWVSLLSAAGLAAFVLKKLFFA